MRIEDLLVPLKVEGLEVVKPGHSSLTFVFKWSFVEDRSAARQKGVNL